ncbi:MAG: AAA family ATPase [Patescibacteria group bacterium]
MELIIIYGPPASGKLTVAKEVAQKTGYRLFHNHLTVDLLKNILQFGTPEFLELNQKIKLDIIEAAAREGVNGVVYTFAYDRKTDNLFVERLKETADRQNISIKFVQIFCERAELLKRVTYESRKEYKKVHSKEDLSRYLKSGDFTSSIENVDSVRIDSTNLSVDNTVSEVLRSLDG